MQDVRVNPQVVDGVDTVRLQEFVLDAYQRIELSEQANLALFLGPSGSGKSTTINYLKGEPMEAFVDDFRETRVRVARGGHEHAAIGHRLATSQTLYTQTILSPSGSFAYCDCAGLGDTRGIVHRITASVSNQLAIRTSASVKAVVFFCTFQGLITSRAQGLREMLPMISGLLTRPHDHMSSIFLAITGVPSDFTLDMIQQMLEQIRFELNEQYNQNQTEELYSRLRALDLLAEHQDNIILVNPLDHGESKDILNQKILGSAPIPKENFRFPESSDTRNALTRVLWTFSDQGLKRLKDYDTIPQRLTEVYGRIRQLNAWISEKIGQIQAIQLNPHLDNHQVREGHERNIAASRVMINEKRAEVAGLENQLRADRLLLSQLDTAEDVVHDAFLWSQKDDIDEKTKTLPPPPKCKNVVVDGDIITRGEYRKSFKYKGIKFTKFEVAESQEGKIEVTKNDPANGVFEFDFVAVPKFKHIVKTTRTRARYRESATDKIKGNQKYDTMTTHAFETVAFGVMNVKIYIEKRHVPINANQILVLNGRIALNEERVERSIPSAITVIEHQIAGAQQAIRTLEQLEISESERRDLQIVAIRNQITPLIEERAQLVAEVTRLIEDHNAALVYLNDVEVRKKLKFTKVVFDTMSPFEDRTQVIEEFMQMYNAHAPMFAQGVLLTNNRVEEVIQPHAVEQAVAVAPVASAPRVGFFSRWFGGSSTVTPPSNESAPGPH